MIDTLLLTSTRLRTFSGSAELTAATGFFFERDTRLYLVTNRHTLFDPASSHEPNRIEIDVHEDADNMADAATVSIPLYRHGTAKWHQGRDSAGEVDVAVVELDPAVLPPAPLIRAFTPAHLALPGPDTTVEIGADLLAVGFPLGFYDTLHKLPVVRRAMLASAFGLRFQGLGCFLTDARTHRGMSGAPIVQRLDTPTSPSSSPLVAAPSTDLPWSLVGIHSSAFDMSTRDTETEDSLGLNQAWYVDILMTLTEPDA